MRKSWRDYVSKLNHKTPTNKVWEMVRKITGKKVFPSIKQLKKDGNNITEVNEIANVLANNIVKIHQQKIILKNLSGTKLKPNILP